MSSGLQTHGVLLEQLSLAPLRLWHFRVIYPAVVVFLLLIGATIALWWLILMQIRAEREAIFERAVSSVVNRLESHVQQHEQILQSVQGLYGGFVQVVRDVFELYATVPVRNNTAVLSIAYAPCVESSRLGSYLHYARSERYWDYRLFPEATQPHLFPLLYVVPPQEALQRTGWNAMVDPVWREAIERAYQQNALTATPWIPLRTAPDTVWGVALIAPVYRMHPHPFSELRVGERFVEGIVLMEIAGHRLFQQALATAAPTDSLIAFEGFDVQPAPGGGVRHVRIMVSPNWQEASWREPALQTERALRIGDRSFFFRFATVPQFEGRFQRWLPWLVLGGGVLTSFVAFGFVLSLVTTRSRALALADQMTRAQRRILLASHDIIAVWELDGRWRTANPAAASLLGYEPDGLAGQPVEALVAPSEREAFRHRLATLPDEEAVLVELPMQTATGQLRWIGWSLTLSRRDGAIYAIGRDVTAQKELQKQQELARRQLLLAEQWALEANEFKTEFLSRLSFQLRNGLTGLMGFTELLARERGASEEERQGYIAAIQESAEYLLSLVAETPEVAAVATLERRPVPLVPLLTELASWAERHGQQLVLPSLEDEAHVVADEGLLSKALQALLQGLASAGIKGTIHLRLEFNYTEGGSEWSVSVPATDKLCRIATLLRDYPPLQALRLDDSEAMFAFLLAQAFLRRLRGELRAECVENSFVVLFTLPTQQPLPTAALSYG